MKNIALWIAGIAIIVMSVLFMIMYFWGGLLMLLAGVALLPPIAKKVNWSKKAKLWTVFGLFISGFVLAVVNMPELTPEQKAQIEAEKQAEIEKEKAQQAKELAEAQAKEAEARAKEAEAMAKEAEAKAKLLEEERLRQVVVPSVAPSVANNVVATYDVNCKIVGISDGDTATCLTSDKQQIKIRFDQIDAPEMGQDFGNASKKALSDLIYNQEVGLDTKEQDKYGRTVAEVFVNDKNINKEMVALGMAWAYREYMKDSEYETLETKARNAGIGIWSQPNPIYPSDYRRGKRGEQAEHVQTKQIQADNEKKALASSGGQCGTKRYCKQMTTCAEAKHYLNVCGVSRLDKDGDGVPCESLCR